VFLFIGRICSESEKGWMAWHETLNRNVFVMLVFGMMSGDLMVTNPAASSRSVLKAAKPCRFIFRYINSCYLLLINVIRDCLVSKEELDDPNFNSKLFPKTFQLIQQVRKQAKQQITIKERDKILKSYGVALHDNGLQLLNTLIRPKQVKISK
jgi:hypothetical protein